ncbi:MAG: glycoside hydrolase family 2 [Oscillospiraceae bacterium]|nr:glycoside hydrolase family 2 [Oscillospiraceae bacterium]
MGKEVKTNYQRLYTKEGRSLPAVPWGRYPRPQMRRAEWLCLNGDWELRFKGTSTRIRVPFCPESLLSGVETPPEVGEEMVYRRTFTVPEAWAGKRVLLHFGAVSREAVICVNGREVCRHENGYLPFSADVTDALREGENELSVAVTNDLSPKYPLGKQSKKRGGMWYTPCSGIWQTVWLEPVPETYVRALHLRCGADFCELEAEGVSSGLVTLDGQTYPLRDGKARIKPESIQRWSPEDPYLYHFTLESGEDTVESYFALRTLEVKNVGGVQRLCLNGKPYFFNALLDQGYWSDGLYTPAIPELYAKDILAMKQLGFNTLRKHIKLEPEQFYYDCDRLGMLVFQDMVNNGVYRFLRDTILPTLKLGKLSDLKLNPDPGTRAVFLDAMERTVRTLGNHPSICLWTIFNEGWGQFCADDAYDRLKALDPGRFIDATSGWFHQKKSDVDSLHIYFGKLHLGTQPLPQLLSEFGGFVWKDHPHSFNLRKTYGYRIYPTREKLVAALRRLYGEALPPLVKQGLCGAVYTQVSDVEDETNGLFTFDREVLKVKPEELRELMEALQEAVQS